MNQFSQRISAVINSSKFHWGIIFFGIALRLIRYLYNPSLWFDESVVATDIINRGFMEFLQPSPDYTQTGPLGFFILIKLAIQVFGNSEYAFRLFPLLFGIISLFLFYKVAKHILNPEAVVIALGLFAILDPLVWYSTTLKPYSIDVAVTLLIYTFVINMRTKQLNMLQTAFFAFAGAVVVWFSHPSIFIIAGVGVCSVAFCSINKEWARLRGQLFIYSIWALSFVALYILYTHNLTSDMDYNMGIEKALKMENSLMPFPPESLKDIRWYVDSFFETFDSAIGLSFAGLAAFAFIVGGISMYSENRERFLLLISPFFFTVVAAALHQYSIKGRLILFLVPLMLLIISEGVAKVSNKSGHNPAKVGIILIALLFLYPFSWATYHIKNPSSLEEIKPVLSYIKDNWQKEDILYIHFYTQYAFEYYSKYYPEPFAFDEKEYLIGIAPGAWYYKWRKNKIHDNYRMREDITQSSTDIMKEYVKDLNKLKGRHRVWILFTGKVASMGLEDAKFFLYHLDTIGKRLDSFGRPGVAVAYLYDLSEQVQ